MKQWELLRVASILEREADFLEATDRYKGTEYTEVDQAEDVAEMRSLAAMVRDHARQCSPP